MMPIDFEGAKTLNKPPGWKDEDCNPMPVFQGVNDKGQPFNFSIWQPSYEDIQAIIAGRPIYLNIINNYQPPVDMWTMDENNERN